MAWGWLDCISLVCVCGWGGEGMLQHLLECSLYASWNEKGNGLWLHLSLFVCSWVVVYCLLCSESKLHFLFTSNEKNVKSMPQVTFSSVNTCLDDTLWLNNQLNYQNCIFLLVWSKIHTNLLLKYLPKKYFILLRKIITKGCV